MRRALAAFLLCMFAASAVPAGADDGLCVTLLHSEPWSYFSPGNKDGGTDGGTDSKNLAAKIEGIMPEISKALARETGLNFRLNLTPYARIWRDLKSGNCDLTYGIRSNDRDDYVRYAGHLFSFETLIIGRPGVRLRTYEDLRSLRIGLLQDIRLEPRFDHDGHLNKHEYRDYETMIEMLLTGRLDAVAGNSVSLNYLLRKKQQPYQLWPRLALQQTGVWVQFSKRSPHQAEAEKITAAVDRLRRQGYFEDLLNTYQAPPKPAD